MHTSCPLTYFSDIFARNPICLFKAENLCPVPNTLKFLNELKAPLSMRSIFIVGQSDPF